MSSSDSAEASRAVVRRFMGASGLGGHAVRHALLHDECVVHTAGGLPFSGEYRGPHGFFELMAAMNEVLELAPGPIVEQSLAVDTVVARFRLTFTARSSRTSVEFGVVEIYRVRGGRITELDVYYKDPQAVAALLALPN
jgi:ketosteroid isomerase-like protein